MSATNFPKSSIETCIAKSMGFNSNDAVACCPTISLILQQSPRLISTLLMSLSTLADRFNMVQEGQKESRAAEQAEMPELRSARSSPDSLWGCQAGTDLSASCDRGSKVLPMVHSQVCVQQQGRTPGIPDLSGHVGRTEGTGNEQDRNHNSHGQSQSSGQGQSWSGTWEPITTLLRGDSTWKRTRCGARS